jgi:hypothetical protein
VKVGGCGFLMASYSIQFWVLHDKVVQNESKYNLRIFTIIFQTALLYFQQR